MTGQAFQQNFLHRSLAIIVITLTPFAGSGAATAAEETWRCCPGLFCDTSSSECINLERTFKGSDLATAAESCKRARSLLTLTADPTNGTGTINFDNAIVRKTGFYFAGLERQWQWFDRDTPYAFVIDTARTGKFWTDYNEVQRRWMKHQPFRCTK